MDKVNDQRSRGGEGRRKRKTAIKARGVAPGGTESSDTEKRMGPETRKYPRPSFQLRRLIAVVASVGLLRYGCGLTAYLL